MGKCRREDEFLDYIKKNSAGLYAFEALIINTLLTDLFLRTSPWKLIQKCLLNSKYRWMMDVTKIAKRKNVDFRGHTEIILQRSQWYRTGEVSEPQFVCFGWINCNGGERKNKNRPSEIISAVIGNHSLPLPNHSLLCPAWHNLRLSTTTPTPADYLWKRETIETTESRRNIPQRPPETSKTSETSKHSCNIITPIIITSKICCAFGAFEFTRWHGPRFARRGWWGSLRSRPVDDVQLTDAILYACESYKTTHGKEE